MTKQVIRYRTCDKCTADVPAAVTDKVTFNGSRYEIDLCETHSLELFGAMMLWLDLGTKTGETGMFDRQQVAKAVTVDLAPPTKKAPEPEPEPAPANVKPLRTVLADDPDLPLTASRWVLTKHAKQRCKDRGYKLAEVLWAAERPSWSVPSRQDNSLEERRKGSCKVVVDPVQNVIVTVIDKDEDEREEFLADFLNRKAQA